MERLNVSKLPEYQNGAEGFIKFVEENVRFGVPQPNSPVQKWVYPPDLPTEKHPETGKSFADMWEKQKQVFRKCLKMRNGEFVYRLIVFCWPRGEGKSFMVCLIQIWKFFCFPRQLIVYGALSKDQTRFVHYDITQAIILNSPKLLNVIGKQNLMHGQIQLKNSKGEVVSSIRPISSYTGIVSNITGYTFSEMFDLKDPKFFVQLDGSTRNIVNALGTIDSTVSTKEHVLYNLYKGAEDGSDRLTYFSHREAPNADPDEFWHPLMTKEQLDSYARKFPKAEFDRYFRNSWELDAGKLFPEPVVSSIFYYGLKDERTQNIIRDDTRVHDLFEQEMENKAKMKKKKRIRGDSPLKREQKQILQKKKLLVPMNQYYNLHEGGTPRCTSNKELLRLGDLFDTNWSIHAGIDRSDPMANDPLARTITTVTAKGLTGSRSSRNMVYEDRKVPAYIYLLLHLGWVEDATLEGIKADLKQCYDEYDGLDTICSERWGAWDLAPWCEELDIQFEAIFPSFDLQRKVFTELFVIIRNARLKSPVIVIPGSKSDNLLEEELKCFDYDPVKKWYGSPQKFETGGIQDDSVFSLGLGIYGGREYGVDDFRERRSQHDFGQMFPGNTTFIRQEIEDVAGGIVYGGQS